MEVNGTISVGEKDCFEQVDEFTDSGAIFWILRMYTMIDCRESRQEVSG